MNKFPDDLFPVLVPDGFEEFQFLGMVPFSGNSILAYFSQILIADDDGANDSITNPRNWTAAAIDPRIQSAEDPERFFVPPDTGVPTFQPEVGKVEVDEDNPKQIIVRFNTLLEARVIYSLAVNDGVRGTDCEKLTGEDTRTSKGLFRGVAPVPRYSQEDVYRDFAMSFFPSDPKQPPATWKFDASGDIGIQTDIEGLRKRLYRRIMTDSGGFSHLGTAYGVGLSLKSLARSGQLQKLANRAASQALQEPDVAEAGAECRLKASEINASIVELSLTVVRISRQRVRFVFDVPAGGT